jgi:hypothetical protein
VTPHLHLLDRHPPHFFVHLGQGQLQLMMTSDVNVDCGGRIQRSRRNVFVTLFDEDRCACAEADETQDGRCGRLEIEVVARGEGLGTCSDDDGVSGCCGTDEAHQEAWHWESLMEKAEVDGFAGFKSLMK